MSETDSFIEEVSEEVRRDALYRYIRRYGWIVVALIVVLVGGTAYNEYRKAQTAAAAAARGDAILDALSHDDAAARRTALNDLARAPEAGIAERLLVVDAGDEASVSFLRGIADDPDLPIHYTDLARLKLTQLDQTMPAQDRHATLETLAQPGAIYRGVAIEYLAGLKIDMGDRDGAVALLRDYAQDAGASAQQRQRVREVLNALGETAQLDDADDADSTGAEN